MIPKKNIILIIFVFINSLLFSQTMDIINIDDILKSDTVLWGKTNTIKRINYDFGNYLVVSNYYFSGEIKSVFRYKENLLSGTSYVFYRNKRIKQLLYLNDNNGFELTFYENGILRQNVQIKEGMKSGICSYYWNNSRLKYIEYWDSAYNTMTYYHENGNKWKEGRVLKTKTKVGEWKEWNKNKILVKIYNFAEQEPDSLIDYVDYSLMNGKYVTYHKNGVIKQKGSYKNGKKDGVWYDFNDKGEVIETISFVEESENVTSKQDDEPYSIVSNSAFLKSCDKDTEKKKCTDLFIEQFLFEEINQFNNDSGNDVKLIYIRFIVNKHGEVMNPEILRGGSKEMNSKIVRLIKKLPEFQPAKKFGKVVSSYYTFFIER